jgi:hypothetical protein
MAGCCEYTAEHSGCINARNFLTSKELLASQEGFFSVD